MLTDIVCFFSIISATVGGILDRAIEAEDRKHGDLLRLVMLRLFNSLVTLLLPVLQHNYAYF